MASKHAAHSCPHGRSSGTWLTNAVLLALAAFGLLPAPTPAVAQDQGVEIHMWVGRHLMAEDPKTFRSMLAFADRHDIVPYLSGARDTLILKEFLGWTTDMGIEKTWLEIGPGRSARASEFVQDEAIRAPALQHFSELGRVYARHYLDGRITIFDEAPLGAFKAELVNGRRNYMKDLEEFRRYGPEAFTMMARALKAEMPGVKVGVFLHHPHNASEAMSGEFTIIEEFMRRADELGQVPDFIYSDIYRGWLARGFGIEGVNDYITDVVGNISTIADRYRAEAYQLGQVHTIKLGHTPSRWEIDTNVDAMFAGSPDGLAWYWPNYSATDHLLISRDPGESLDREYDVSFRPFVPNSQGRIGPAGSVFGTSRDRFVYSYLRLLEEAGAIEDRERFDLYLYGYDFDHVEHDVYIKASGEADWTYLGSVNPQQDRSGYVPGADTTDMYSYDGVNHAVVFHALERDAFLADGQIELRIETEAGADGSSISAAWVLPYRATRNYLTEAEATLMIEKHPRWMDINSLARYVRPRPLQLQPGQAVEVVLETREPLTAATVDGWSDLLNRGHQ